VRNALSLSVLPWLVVATCALGCDDKEKQAAGAATPSEPKREPPAASTAPPEPPPIVLEGVDLEGFTSREKKEFAEAVKQLLSPCPDVPVPLAQCIQEKRDCAACVPAARLVARAVRAGQPRELVENGYKNRFDPAAVKDVPVDGSPCSGPDIAPVTIVEFADFECSACGMMFPRVHKLLEERKNSVRFCFKFKPMPAHPHGEIAARAAIASMAQGKFWEMHDKLFKNQQHLEQSDLDGYAKDLGLDAAKFRADATGTAANDRLAKDRDLGNKLGVAHTPTLFINGRQYDKVTDLDEWVAIEIGLAKAPKSSPVSDAGKGDAASAKDAAASAKK
jgi:protein-disulfide isomerase